jgi:hypothetical protein
MLAHRPLPLCMVFLHCSYFAMFAALLIVNRWFAIISRPRNSDFLLMNPDSFSYGPHCCHHLSFCNSIVSNLTSSAFHVVGFHCILSICFIHPTFITNNPVPRTYFPQTPEHYAKRPCLEGSEMPRTPPNATQAALLQAQGMSYICSLCLF